MTICTILGKGYDSNIFLIKGKKPTLIDTGTGINKDYIHSKIQSYINPESIVQIILTHEHFDHVGGSEKILGLIGGHVKILAHEDAKKKIERKESLFANLLGSSMPNITIDQTVDDGDHIIIGDNNYEVIYTPGHTPGCICLYCKETKTLFSGDTLFSYGSFGRTDFPGGSIKQLKESVEHLTNLDIHHLYPGHESIVENEAKHHILLSYRNICSLC